MPRRSAALRAVNGLIRLHWISGICVLLLPFALAFGLDVPIRGMLVLYVTCIPFGAALLLIAVGLARRDSIALSAVRYLHTVLPVVTSLSLILLAYVIPWMSARGPGLALPLTSSFVAGFVMAAILLAVEGLAIILAFRPGVAELFRPSLFRCRVCNYDLHGLADGATCPECGCERAGGE